jgi:putative flippase GtrA
MHDSEDRLAVFGVGIQFLKYCIVGLTNTAVDLVFYYFLTRYVGFSGNLVYFAKSLSFALATLNSYVLNGSWTFRQKSSFTWGQFGKFYMTIGGGIVINVGVHLINIALFGINDFISAAISAAGTAVWGFVLAKTFVFK